MIIVIPYVQKDQERAERICDLIYWYGGWPHCLLAIGPDVHPEYQEKVKWAAEVAFRSVDVMQTKVVTGQTRNQQINDVFGQVCAQIRKRYWQPWLWLEPSCVLLDKSGLSKIQDAYESQPRRYMGAIMEGKVGAEAKKGRFLSRVAVYPHDAGVELEPHCKGQVPFNRMADIMPASTNSNLFKVVPWQDGMDTGESVLIDGDKTGVLIERVMDGINPKSVAKTGKKVKIPA